MNSISAVTDAALVFSSVIWRAAKVTGWNNRSIKAFSYRNHVIDFFSSSLCWLGRPVHAETKTAIFAGGCFWCMQEPFDQVKGVTNTVVGYTGGSKEDANYPAVSAHKTRASRGDRDHIRFGRKSATINCSMSSGTTSIRPREMASSTTSGSLPSGHLLWQ